MDSGQQTLWETIEGMRKSEDGSFKKVMVYQTTISFIMENREAAIQKIRNNLTLFQENADAVLLVFSPHENCDQLAHHDPEMQERFQEIVNDYLEQDFGIYDAKHESEEMAERFDAYYGDASALAHHCHYAGVPVMLEAII